ncbi:heme lyase CcmF/NrfE family subunit [candidate division KSB1 bacterium]
MGNIGNIALIVAFTLSAYTIIASVFGIRLNRNDLLFSAERSVYATFVMTAVASFALFVLFAKSDFHYEYVYSYSNEALPMAYKIAAFWAGQVGSLLLWLLIFAGVAAAAVFQNRNKNHDLMPYVMAVFGIVTLFFTFVSLFLTNPFTILVTSGPAGIENYVFPDGRGLNPLLQHPVMAIHPPILFVGYSAFLVPFAFAIAALITRQSDASWLKVTRRWTLFSWLFLGAGILLGAKWAYVELGWGGYWGWDPVENASLFPWLTGTAFLHSSMIQEKRGMFKVWNMILIILTFTLCIFGTFLTRSGIITNSVHAFGESPIGTAFGYFLLFLFGASLLLLVSRLPIMKSENQLDSYLSRESTFLFNNLILFGAMLATLWGTVYPIISEIFVGEQISVGIDYFMKVNIPIGLFLLFLTGVGPLFAWRKTTTYSLKKHFIIPTAVSVTGTALLVVTGIREVMPLISFYLCFFVAAAVAQEFMRGALARTRVLGESFTKALLNVTLANTRRSGGYTVHFGMVLLFIGFTGNAFNLETTAKVSVGESYSIGDYDITVRNISDNRNALYEYRDVELTITRDGTPVTNTHVQRRYYFASEQTVSELAVHSTMKEDVYIVFSGIDSQSGKAVLQSKVNPLVMWVWIGSIVLVLGTMLAMTPNRKVARSGNQPLKQQSKLEIQDQAG